MLLPLIKRCRQCHEEKSITAFHKHSGMKDGHLNTCSQCVVTNVSEWRRKNPGVRKKEYEKVRKKKGADTRAVYLEKRKARAKGRKVSLLAYMHKRRVQQERFQTELDSFVFQEAVYLTSMRESCLGGKWHVDHIVPLNHKKACGLHNAYNLQVVPAEWNLRKGNRNMDIFNIAGY